MKLSEMNAAQLAQTMCDLVPPLCAIAADKRVAEALERFAEDDDGKEPMIARGAALLGCLVPLLLRTHADEFFRAAAILTGKSADTLRRQSGLATVRELRACWDEDLAAFFTCAAAAKQSRC